MLTELIDRWTRRNRSDRFPITLTRKRVYILPTSLGLVFFAVLFAMLLGALNYNNNLGFLFTFLLGSLSFVSLLHTHRNLSGITIQAGAVSPVFAGETASLTLTLAAGAMGRVGLNLWLSGKKILDVTLPSGTRTRVVLPMATHKRGQFSPGPITLASAYPFGLFRTWATVYPDLSYLVYPRPLSSPLHFGGGGRQTETDGGYEVTGTEDFRELRNYRPGDPLSRLSWKSFSRGRGLHTKVFTAHAGGTVMLDWDGLAPEDIETRLSKLCDMVKTAHTLGLRYGLTVPGTVVPPSEPGDGAHYHLCLKTLALYGTRPPGEEV
ncbi:DUF58 domain-containing protein [Desulfatiferula olefinivorans]